MDSEVTNLSGVKTLTIPDNTVVSSYGKSLVDDNDSSTARNTLGIYTGTYTVSGGSSEIIGVSNLVTGVNELSSSSTILFHSNKSGLIIFNSVLEDTDFNGTLESIRITFNTSATAGDIISYFIIPIIP